MNSSIGRFVAAHVALFAVLVTALTATPSASAAPRPSSMVHVYHYDASFVPAVAGGDVHERPPETHAIVASPDAVDPESHGVSARPESTAPYSYDHQRRLAQIDNIGTATKRPARGAERTLRQPARSGVAAKTTPELASGMERTGTALTKGDAFHRSVSGVVDNPAAQRFAIKGGDGVPRELYQLPGEVNGKSGVFEWIIDRSGSNPVINHQRFIPGGSITGVPNQVVP